MKQKHPSLNAILGTFFTTVIVLFILLHITPSMAVRTSLFLKGFYGEAFTAKITVTNKHTDASEGARGTIYKVAPKPKSNRTYTWDEAQLNAYIVHTCVLSFADIHWYG